MNWISKENMSVTHYYDANMIHLSVTMGTDIQAGRRHRTRFWQNIFFGDGSDESYETGRGLSNIVVEPLEEYYEE